MLIDIRDHAAFSAIVNALDQYVANCEEAAEIEPGVKPSLAW